MNGDDLLRQAREALRLGDRQAAVALFARLIQANPASVEAWLGMSQAVEAGEKRVYCLSRVLKLDPENLDAWLDLGLTLEDKEKRVYCLKRVLRLDPGNLEAHQALRSLQGAPPFISPIPEPNGRGQESSPSIQPVPPLKDGEAAPLGHKHSPFGTINWTLWIGILMAVAILLVAIFGPAWAPQNPMEEHYTLMVDGKIRTPPYSPFKVDGFPLGTDNFGRDLWSRILWGVRPTMIMVASVAGIRLFLGTLLGLLIGWAEGRLRRPLESILSTALSIPVLIVAIIGIYAVGVDKGLLAFIIGLGVTGWAETARLVSEQTRLVKKQLFIEAVRSMGASERYIIFVHVVRHITPLLWMLLAFEISSTLLISAELGFLGYYIGGGVYVEISDFVAVNTAGLPELGQMLSSALQKLTEPLALIVVGTVIFLGVLGFNLLGEGLRREVSVERMRRSRLAGLLPQDWAEKLEHHLMRPTSDWLQDHRRLVSALVFAVLLLIAAWIVRGQIYIPSMGTRQGAMPVPGGHLWATERRDPYGTLWTEVSLETAPEMLWSYTLPGGPTGGPAVGRDGVVYIAAREQVLVALNPDGTLSWQAPLQAVPVGVPALNATGTIFVSDVDGAVTAFSPSGDQLWRSSDPDMRYATSGPVVAEPGMIYFTIDDAITALSPEGDLIWRKAAADVYTEYPPRLNASGDMVFLLDAALSAVSGTPQPISLIPEVALLFMDPAFFTGADGKDYYRYGHELLDWQLSDTGAVAGESRTWSYQSMVLFNPYDQGVTPDGLGWLYYTSQYSESRLVWIDESSRVVGNFLFPRLNAHLVALGGRNEAYLCGTTGARLECVCAGVGQDEPLWTVMVDQPGEVVGGALVPGRLYVALKGDGLIALEPPR